MRNGPLRAWLGAFAALCSAPARAETVFEVPGTHDTLVSAFYDVDDSDDYLIIVHEDQAGSCLAVDVPVRIRSGDGEGPFRIPALYTRASDVTLHLENVRVEGGCYGIYYPQDGATSVELPTLLHVDEGRLEAADVTLEEGHEGVGVAVFDSEAVIVSLQASGFTSGSPLNLISEQGDVSVEVYGSRFVNNGITAIYAASFEQVPTTIELEVYSSTFEGNQDDSFGRAVDASLSQVDRALFEDCTFVGDGSMDDLDADRAGGSIYAEDTELLILDSRFSGYRAGMGGAIYAGSGGNVGSLSISGGSWAEGLSATFADCAVPSEGGRGGAIFTSGIPVSLKGIQASGGQAAGGAFLYSTGRTSVSLEDLWLTDHGIGGDGGVVRLDWALAPELQRVRICDVTPLSDYGAGTAVVLYESRLEASVHNNVFDRIDDETRPLLYFTGETLTMRNNTLNANRTLSTIEVFAGELNFWNNIVSGRPVAPPVFYSEVEQPVYAAYNLFEHTESDWPDLGNEIVAGEGTLTELDPLFIAEYIEAVDCGPLPYLAEGSPAIDAGDPSYTEGDDGSRSDMGAFGGEDRELRDQDGDGFTEATDCDDLDAHIYPGAIDDTVDGLDQDCDGIDGDGGGDTGDTDDTGDTGDTGPSEPRSPARGLSGGCSCGAGLERRPSFMLIWGLLAMVMTRRQR